MKLLPYLVNVLDVTDEQEVKIKATREDSIDKLLEILPRRGPKAFDDFVKALQEVQPFLAAPLVQESEMEEIKTELNRARTNSARLREEVHLIRTSLEKEQQKHKKTCKELDELKSIHETLMAKGEEDKQNMQTRVQELETTINRLEEELSTERSSTLVFTEETARLRKVCDQMDEELRDFKESYEKVSEENKELVAKLAHYKNNVLNETVYRDALSFISRHGEHEVVENIPNVLSTCIPYIDDEELEIKPRRQKSDSVSAALLDETRRDLARVTTEYEELKERYEDLEKQLEDTLASLERQRSASFHDRATSPGEPIHLEFEENQECSQCKALGEECNLLTTEKDFFKEKKENFEDEIKKLNKEMKELRSDHLREKQALQKEIQSMREEHEKLSRDFEKELQKMLRDVKDQQESEMKALHGQNDELNDQINKLKSDIQKAMAQLKKEKSQLEKNQEDLAKAKKNLAREKKKLKETKEELGTEVNAKTDALKELAKLKNELCSQEKKRCEDIERLRKDFVERCKCDLLREEIQRLRNMSGRVLNYRKDFDRHGVIYALGTNFGTTPWVNPGSNSASPTRIIATRSSDEQGVANDLLDNRRGGTLSGTKDEDKSWWCVDLSEKYALFLTHYTLRHGRDNGMSIVRNWRLEGSLDGRSWKVLKKHENDRGLKEPFPYYTATWSVDGDLGAFRYFRIFQTGKNSSGRFSIFLSGIELYGVLIELGN